MPGAWGVGQGEDICLSNTHAPQVAPPKLIQWPLLFWFCPEIKKVARKQHGEVRNTGIYRERKG